MALPLTPTQINHLLEPYLEGRFDIPLLFDRLSTYLELLVRWNARTNLTSVGDPEEIVQRHFGESLFAARFVEGAQSLLDFGSGAGFPGIPIQLVCPDLRVTLAESQNKKSAFLREVVRALELPSKIWPSRVEAMPPSAMFDVVTLRAVDKPNLAFSAAEVRSTGTVLVMGSEISYPSALFDLQSFSLPQAVHRSIHLYTRQQQQSNDAFHVEQSVDTFQIVPRRTK